MTIDALHNISDPPKYLIITTLKYNCPTNFKKIIPRSENEAKKRVVKNAREYGNYEYLYKEVVELDNCDWFVINNPFNTEYNYSSLSEAIDEAKKYPESIVVEWIGTCRPAVEWVMKHEEANRLVAEHETVVQITDPNFYTKDVVFNTITVEQ